MTREQRTGVGLDDGPRCLQTFRPSGTVRGADRNTGHRIQQRQIVGFGCEADLETLERSGQKWPPASASRQEPVSG